MSKFRLVQKASNQVKTTFHVLSGDDVVGSINVHANEVGDLLKCWIGPKQQPAKAQARNPFVEAVLKAKTRAMTRQTVLRTC
jgi:hypothetical protein